MVIYSDDLKVVKIRSISTQNRQKAQKSAERQNASFSKELIGNADLYKHVLNNMMTTQ